MILQFDLCFFLISEFTNLNHVILFMRTDEQPLLLPSSKPLVRRLCQGQRLIVGTNYKKRLRKQPDVLQGQRGIRFPLIALTSQRSMGPSRHILAQKVVGGTMVIHPPFDRPKSTIQSTINNSRTHFWRKS